MADIYIDNQGNLVKKKDYKALALVCVINALAMVIAEGIVDGMVFSSLFALLLSAFIFTVINLSIKPIIQIAALPLTVLSLGFFALVINGFMLWLVAWITPGFTIASFGTAIWASIIVSIANMLIDWVLIKIS